MATLRELIIKISANSQSFQSEISRASRMGQDYHRTMQNGGRQAASAQRETQRALASVTAQLNTTRTAALGLTGAFAGAFATANLIRLADSYNSLSARVKLATGDATDFATAQKGLMDISQRTGSAFADNAALFSRASTSLREWGFGTQDILKLTDALANGLQVSGASAEETSSLIVQLSQALGRGVLRGQDFNSVAQSGQRIMKALADGMGVAQKDLKGMADAGQLTTDKIVPALISQLSKLKAEFDSMPNSVGAASTRIQNAFMEWVGGANKASGATATISGVMDDVSKNIDSVATAAGVLVSIGLARYLGGMASGAISASTSLIGAAKREIALADAQVRGTQISTARARAAVYRAQQALVAARGTDAQAAAEKRLSAAQQSLTRNIAARSSAQTSLNNVTSIGSRMMGGALSLVGGFPGLILLGNGGAEYGTDFWENITAYITTVTASPYIGSRCFAFSGPASTQIWQGGLLLKAGRTYRASAMVRCSAADAVAGWGNTKLSVRTGDSNTEIKSVSFKSGNDAPVTWTQFTVDYKPETDAMVRLTVFSWLTSGSTMWVDDVRLEDITDALANGVTADAVTKLETTVSNQGDVQTAQTRSIQSLNTSLGSKADASALTQTNATVTQQGKDIKANTESVSSLKARVEGAESGLNQTFESIAQGGFAQFRGFYDQRAEIVSNDRKITASINEVNVTIANEAGAVAQQMSTLEASVGDNAAAIQMTSSALADVSGKLSAQWGVKVQVDAQGRSYIAGIQLGIDGDGSSQFLIDADTFGIYNPNAAGGRVLAFAVSGATAYLRAAMIQDLSIDFGKISDTLRSTNFVPGQQGWNLPKNGNAELNNVTIRGTVYANAGEMNNILIKETCTVQGRIEANDGWFKGTVYAEKLEGDVVKSFTIGINGTAKIEPAPYPRRIVAISAPMMAATATRIENSTVTYLYGQAHMTLQLFAGDGGTANIFDKHIAASNSNQTVFDVAEGSWLLNAGVYYEVTYRASGGVGPSGFPQNYTFLVVKN